MEDDLTFWLMEDDLSFGKLKMEDDLNFFGNGRRPKKNCKWKTTSHFCKWKTTSIFLVNGRGSHFFVNERKPLVFQMKGKLQMEDDPDFFLRWMITSHLWLKEDNCIFV